jgi:ATP-binding cassette, subfamily A (ABC1), member 3
MSMLIGMIPPTSGNAYINGFDIVTDIEKARNSIGICPQHNILFDNLTVREHIIFFCRLKGMRDSKKINEEVQKYIKILELTKNVRSKALSGGQKRRLSIANALCGQSTFVILDEVDTLTFLTIS